MGEVCDRMTFPSFSPKKFKELISNCKKLNNDLQVIKINEINKTSPKEKPNEKELPKQLQAAFSEKIKECNFTTEGILIIMFLNFDDEILFSSLQLYLTKTRYIKLLLTGKDLIKNGFSAGKDLGFKLKTCLFAKINGLIPFSDNQEEQKKLELQWIIENQKK